jgi:hypothetical protein
VSRFICAFRRRGRFPDGARKTLEAALRELAEPADERTPAIRSALDDTGRHVQATCDVPDRYPRRGLALCLGKLYEPAADWWTPGDAGPDGSYAIVREDENVLEAVSDPAGSRMLWYYFDDELLVVSSSERAITMFVGRFDFDRAAVPWIMSTGTRGLGRSYNRHLRLVPPAGVLRLDKEAWTLAVVAAGIRFAEVPRSRAEHLAALEAALSDTFASFGADDARNLLISLSGGTDSRALAVFLARLPDLRWRSFTGGSEDAAALTGSDVTIGARVAAALGLDHRQIVARPARGRIEDRLRRFVIQSEGRHEHVNALAGTNAAIRDTPAEGIVRGDECFGWKPAASPVAIRHSMDLLLCSDIANFRGRLAEFGLEGQTLPATLERHPDETLPAWRDRLYAGFRVPTVLAAFNEAKAGFYDTLNPLVSRRALEVARSLPDELRTGKALFRELVDRLGPDVPYATREGAPRHLETLRGGEDVRQLLRAALASETARDCLGAPLAGWLRAGIHPARDAADRVLGAVARRVGRKDPASASVHRVPPLRLAFRAWIAITMVDQLTADAARFAAAAPLARTA